MNGEFFSIILLTQSCVRSDWSSPVYNRFSEAARHPWMWPGLPVLFLFELMMLVVHRYARRTDPG